MKLVTFLVLLYAYGIVAPPVNEKKKKDEKEDDKENEVDSQVLDVEYKRYLQEVVNVLENDEEFRNRLMKADPDDIKNGKIAKELEFVNHNVRSKLDELKRQELERLRHAAVQQYEHANGIDKKHLKIPGHIDPKNPHTFEAEDLRKLIIHTAKELEEADRQRKDEFKEYEMRKELEYQEQLKHLDEKNRQEAQKQHEALMEKHKKHEPLHHPGSKQQFEEVWEEQDHLSPEDFNPKTFFHLHDLDGNGVWDANEVKALFKKELDKLYDPNAPEDDMRERYEEMERMREHVFNETDTNRDQLISYDEFVEQTKKQDFERDEGWKGLDEQPAYSQDEYQAYAQNHEEEIRRMMEQGLIPPAPPGYVPLVIPPDQQYHPQQGHPPMHPPPYHAPPPGAHPNAIPHGQPPQYQQHPDPNYQYHPQAPPQQQQYQQAPGQGHPQQYQQAPGQGHPPQYQGVPQQVPHQQIPVQQNQHVPVQQYQQPPAQGNQQHQVPEQQHQQIPVQSNQHQQASDQQQANHVPVQQQQQYQTGQAVHSNVNAPVDHSNTGSQGHPNAVPQTNAAPPPPNSAHSQNQPSH